MLQSMAKLVGIGLVLLGSVSNGSEPGPEKPARGEQAIELIASALEQANGQSDEERLEIYRQAAKQLQGKYPKNVLVAEQLQAAQEADGFEKALRNSQEILTFQMKQEADLPAGFPEPTPVGEIQIKQYPAYRLARTESQQDSGFFRLFAHITSNQIEMTAPVEMTYDSPKGKSLRQLDMAFLYGDPKTGEVGKKLGGVTVEDVPAMTTVSIGMKGESERANLAPIEERLEAWLAENAPEYERSGKLRLLGYNSPQVPAKSRYYEVELPVRKKSE